MFDPQHWLKRSLAPVLVATLLAAAPLSAQAQDVASVTAPTPSVQSRLFTMGSGALLGIVAFNLLTAPLGTVPFAGAVLEPVPTSIALGSRLIAAGSGAAGALGAVWLYDHMTGRPFEAGWAASRVYVIGSGVLGALAGSYLYQTF